MGDAKEREGRGKDREEKKRRRIEGWGKTKGKLQGKEALPSANPVGNKNNLSTTSTHRKLISVPQHLGQSSYSGLIRHILTLGFLLIPKRLLGRLNKSRKDK